MTRLVQECKGLLLVRKRYRQTSMRANCQMFINLHLQVCWASSSVCLPDRSEGQSCFSWVVVLKSLLYVLHGSPLLRHCVSVERLTQLACLCPHSFALNRLGTHPSLIDKAGQLWECFLQHCGRALWYGMHPFQKQGLNLFI